MNNTTNNCTKRNPEATPKATQLFEGKSMEEIIRIAQDIVPGSSTTTFSEAIETLKNVSATALVYTAEEYNRGIDTEVAMEAIKRIQADQERAKKLEEEAIKREKEWMTVGIGKVWLPVYAYCKAILSSAYTNPIKDMAVSIMNALTASSDQIHTSTVLSVKLTQAYAATEQNTDFLRQLTSISEYMESIYTILKSGTTEDGFYKLEDVKYAVKTWLETAVKPNQNN